MTLSTAAKEYIALHFGAVSGTQQCFVSSGISYTDPAGAVQVGSTQDVVATLKMDIGGAARGPGGEVYTSIPNWSDITNDDVVWIGNSMSGASQYCYTSGGDGGDVEAIVGTFTFGAPPSGKLDGSISVPSTKTMGIEMSNILQKTWFWINGVQITNASAYSAFTTVELRMWPGAQSSCGTKASAIKSINRNVEELFIRNIKKPDGTPITGIHTVCLYLWANFSKYDLNYELEMEGYTNPSPE